MWKNEGGRVIKIFAALLGGYAGQWVGGMEFVLTFFKKFAYLYYRVFLKILAAQATAKSVAEKTARPSIIPELSTEKLEAMVSAMTSEQRNSAIELLNKARSQGQILNTHQEQLFSILNQKNFESVQNVYGNQGVIYGDGGNQEVIYGNDAPQNIQVPENKEIIYGNNAPQKNQTIKPNAYDTFIKPEQRNSLPPVEQDEKLESSKALVSKMSDLQRTQAFTMLQTAVDTGIALSSQQEMLFAIFSAPAKETPLQWDTQAVVFAAEHFSVDGATGTLRKIGSDNYATAHTTTVAGPVTTWTSVELGATGHNDIMWGLVRSSAHLPKGYTSCQPGVYLLWSYNEKLYGPDENGQNPMYGTQHPQWQKGNAITAGTKVAVHWARATGTISFQINNGPLLLAFTGVPPEVDLYPAVQMYWEGTTVRLQADHVASATLATLGKECVPPQVGRRRVNRE